MSCKIVRFILAFVFFIITNAVVAQYPRKAINWTKDGNSFYHLNQNEIDKIDIKTGEPVTFVSKQLLIPAGSTTALKVERFSFYDDNTVLLFTNSAKVWRYRTKGDYWVLNIAQKKLTQVGKGKPAQSLMFAKISPDGKSVAYVSEHNLFTEDIATGTSVQLTFDGTRKLINGTFDWVYEEEFGCRDGFRWSPDGKKIAYWQVDATQIRDYYMLNTTDSVYSKVIPVEYPKVGESPSPVRIGVVNASGGATQWMNIEGDPRQHYLPRMEWADANTLVVQQLNRKQQESKLIYCDAASGSSTTFYKENDNAWIDIKSRWDDDDPTGWDWINNGKEFIWVSEKDGWRHIYKVSRDGKTETLLTNGQYDIANIKAVDEASNTIYFMASPDNATQLYLYRVKMDGKSKAVLVSPAGMKGVHDYYISSNGKFAEHEFSSHNVNPIGEWVTLPDGKPVDEMNSIEKNETIDTAVNIEYAKVTTEDGITVDVWINKPLNFDSTKKYPVVLYVYGEPGASTVDDSYGNQQNFLYDGDMGADGYIQIGVDNRGTPTLKGSAWRRSIYRKIGIVNIRDMAMATKKLLERPYFDKDRVAVWGWSGGAASTLNLLCQYPQIFKTGIAISAITNELFYDNIYTERYMGLPQENMEDYVKTSPLTYVKNLQGNLLYVHGSGDDNVHYDNAEALLNELIKYNKQFQFMEYPNRTHSISEGIGTRQHLSTLYSNYLRTHCLPGAK
ncbi:S9 family peptidase [Ferruginibacter albus]|uniref:S9 family peptidase n=1 Tax=Ferruginibacter albus TaxID=2875540 RepID=UPI001CC74AF9|nr:S9 family peptidase [Ferruginibacter albus]UAY51633.1 S9 family peptidase [Ferruginibacter albus]